MLNNIFDIEVSNKTLFINKKKHTPKVSRLANSKNNFYNLQVPTSDP